MNVQILNRDLSTYGVIGDFESLSFTQAFRSRGRFEIEINSNKTGAKYLQLDKIVYIDEHRIGYIDKITLEEKSSSSGKVRIAEGYELKDRLDRLIYPAAGNVPDSYTSTKVETIIKTLLKKNAGTDAATIRQFSNLNIKTDQQRGSSINYSAWRKDITSEIYNLLAIDKMGLICEIDFTNSKITYDVRVGDDKTAAPDKAGGVMLSVKENTVLSLTDTDDRMAYKNLSVTAGAGTPEEREVLEVGTTATGYDRREVSTDARDALNTDNLTTAGNLKLAEFQKTRAIKVDFNADGRQKLNEKFYLGDVVSAESDGEFFDAQVTKIISKYSSSNNIPQVDLVLGFDLDDIIMVEEKARRMDQEALKAAGAGGSGVLKLAAEKVFTAAANSHTFTGLDLKADGGTYWIEIIGYVPTQIKLRVNGDTADTNYAYTYLYGNGANPLSGGALDSSKICAISSSSAYTEITGHIRLVNNNGTKRLVGLFDTSRSGAQVQITTWTKAATISNATSMKIFLDSGSFTEETLIRIWKQAA